MSGGQKTGDGRMVLGAETGGKRGLMCGWVKEKRRKFRKMARGGCW